ncbi:MAG TPA: hypothetical protein VFV67_05970, partial [Actinophytocola sp.]|nr:hypothetical protein [Actinophytocola sp.]
ALKDNAAVNAPASGGGDDGKDELVMLEEEIEGYRVVRAIVCSEVPTGRIVARDTKSYFGILLDDNNRRPIARLWFNRTKKYLGIFDEHKVETRVPITGVEDIYLHADALRKTVGRYLSNAGPADEPMPADHPVPDPNPVPIQVP